MTKKKRHHYIPRFYLKRFSVNNEGIFLGLYNLNNRKFVKNAPLKNQAYENFLYGEDNVLEDALAEMEGNVAKMFYSWTEEKLLYAPPPETNGFKLLKQFILCQKFRTPKSGNDTMETLNQGLKKVFNELKPDDWKSIKNGTLVHLNPIFLRLRNAINHERLLNFLDCKFIVNLSLLPFITSDSPVIFYNQLLEKAGNYIGATGLVSKGLQMFYPIHPRLMICLYDPEVYDFNIENNDCCSTESIDEVHQLNGLQLANCNSQLFFDDLISEDYILELREHFEEFRGRARNINRIINKGNKKLLFTSFEDVSISLNLAFFKLKVDPRNFMNEIAPLRHSSFAREIYM
jgi:hypothetical protein